MTVDQEYILPTQKWIENFVIGLELCPFAAAPFEQKKIGYTVLLDDDLEKVAQEILIFSEDLLCEEDIETRFILTPKIDLNFPSFYRFSSGLQEHIDKHQSSRTTLVAFHPDFQYYDSVAHDPANSTNQSPFPMIHLLSSESMEEAETSGISIGGLLNRNQDLLRSMTPQELRKFKS